VLCIAQFLVLRPLSAAVVATPVIWLSVLNAVACTVAPVLMVMMAIERVGPAITAQAGMIGPISTILMSLWLLDEPFTPWLAAGTLCVMVGVTMMARIKR
jgi:drug/metabolite transporter (DMT)-like permease